MMVKNKKITHGAIYALVNSIQAARFETRGTQISFEYIVDDRFMQRNNMLHRIKSMIKRFREKADKMGLEYRVGNIRELYFGEPEPSKQLRVKISITKPRYQQRRCANADA